MNTMLESMSSKIEEFSVADKKRHDTMELMQYTLLQEQKQLNQSFDLLLKNTKLGSNKTINELFAKQQKVAVTACVSSSQTFPDYVVRFSTVNFKEGIDNLDMFKFRWEISHIYTNTQGYGFNVKKNGMNIATSASGSGSTDTTNPISAVVELQPNDTLYVYAGHYIYSSQSCMSIMKIN
ncbi:Hypothetical predicted protein [Mytilus galloprovincialis]|uniref:C1q domain-containing protein n=1 Tax=Mytilus galloprovincialis TaxID=29158 RepID=A0A8B6ESM5_MYTGA|nr:Hypothetical predicted protein [Mytilus galloprovincialis]